MLKRKITERAEDGKILKYVTLLDGTPIKEDHIYCKVCNTVKPKEEFSLDKKGKYGKTSTCKPCAAQRAREHHAKRMLNPAWLKKYQKKNRDRMREYKLQAIAYKGGACEDCGSIFHPSVYDFHHLDTKEKEGNPSYFFRSGMEKAKKELDKCVLLCANCHRKRHYEEDEAKL